jgi:hypothetical protein
MADAVIEAKQGEVYSDVEEAMAEGEVITDVEQVAAESEN